MLIFRLADADNENIYLKDEKSVINQYSIYHIYFQLIEIRTVMLSILIIN